VSSPPRGVVADPRGARPAAGAASDRVAGLRADLFLLHAPSVYDFRERDDVLFAYLSDSDSVNVTPVYEMYPLGFFSLRQHLRERGFQAEIVNLASLMLRHPDLDVEGLLGRLEAPVFGFDLHWMAQCHGSVELAGRLKKLHPESLIIFGGISATYFAEELIRYPGVDVVVQGYDTLEPVARLMEAVRRGERRFEGIPNLLYKQAGQVVRSGFTHKPAARYNDATVDWSDYGRAPTGEDGAKLIMTLPNTGCAMDCPWCGGSRFAYRNIMGVRKTLIQKEHRRILDELRSLGEAARTAGIYALQCYSETKARLHEYLDAVAEMEYRSVYFEQFHLTPEDTLRKMGRSTRAYIMLSPESHDREISRLAGRGNYSMAEMEAWIPRALDAGIKGIMVWFFIGMPRQTPRSVMETVDYCESLLGRFGRRGVLPLVCPMVPFLDPGSRFFESPRQHGYRLFHRTLEEHRRAMVAPLWHQRLNYETDWLSRRQLQDVTYDAIDRLVSVKGGLGILPAAFCRGVRAAIDETRRLLAEMEQALGRGALPAGLREAVRAYNRRMFAGSRDQIMPISRAFGGRWFDDATVPASLIECCRVRGASAAHLAGEGNEHENDRRPA
jgi:clorobiocin/coumermycin A biosynthesis protein CloN6/CouN6